MADKQLLKRYEGVIEPWKVRLAFTRMRAMGLSKEQWPDLMQELVVKLLMFDFEPDRANGAAEQTVVFAIITNHLRFRIRGLCREQQGRERYQALLGADDRGCVPEPVEQVDLDLGIDVTDGVNRLSQFDRQVAILLAHGLTRFAISKRLGCSWNRVQRSIKRIRRQLASLDPEGGDEHADA